MDKTQCSSCSNATYLYVGGTEIGYGVASRSKQYNPNAFPSSYPISTRRKFGATGYVTPVAVSLRLSREGYHRGDAQGHPSLATLVFTMSDGSNGDSRPLGFSSRVEAADTEVYRLLAGCCVSHSDAEDLAEAGRPTNGRTSQGVSEASTSRAGEYH